MSENVEKNLNMDEIMDLKDVRDRIQQNDTYDCEISEAEEFCKDALYLSLEHEDSPLGELFEEAAGYTHKYIVSVRKEMQIYKNS